MPDNLFIFVHLLQVLTTFPLIVEPPHSYPFLFPLRPSMALDVNLRRRKRRSSVMWTNPFDRQRKDKTSYDTESDLFFFFSFTCRRCCILGEKRKPANSSWNLAMLIKAPIRWTLQEDEEDEDVKNDDRKSVEDIVEDPSKNVLGTVASKINRY